MYSSMHSSGRGVNRVERTLLNFFMRRGVRGGCFRALEGCFAGGDFGAAARREWAVLPRNSAVFWTERGRGAAIQRTADTAGQSERKKILKKGRERVKNRKIGVREVPEGGAGAPYIGCAGRFLGLETRPLAALLEVRFVQVPQLRAPAVSIQSEISKNHSYIWRTNLQTLSLSRRGHLRLSDP